MPCADAEVLAAIDGRGTLRLGATAALLDTTVLHRTHHNSQDSMQLP
jgi:hypothetical protein